MRVLVVTKRQYTNRDLLDDKFGRLRELPLALARRGHEVLGLCLSYSSRSEGESHDVDKSSPARVTWHSLNATAFKPFGLLRFSRHLDAVAAAFQPDVIWACSDSFYGILGTRLARRLSTHCVFDLYDNFESFASTRIPGVLPLYRHAVRTADGVTCVSHALRDMVVQGYGRTKPTLMLSNAVDHDLFRRRDKRDCRRKLGLPINGKLIGTAGALETSRGIEALLRGFELLAKTDETVHLAIAGPRGADVRIPRDPRVHDLGVLRPSEVPLLLGSLDVAAVCNKDSAFGRYCFPQKAYEILACHVPVVAARVGAMELLLADFPEILFEPGDAADFSRAARRQLDRPVLPDVPVPNWDDIAAKLDEFLKVVVNG